MQHAILLNGPSSSGKSTLARSLQEQLEGQRRERYGIVSIDDVLSMTAEEPIYEDDVFAVSPALCERAAALLRAGQGVIIDHVITSERIYRQLTEALRGWPLFTVHVTCPPEILRQREQQRRNRCPGSAEASCSYLYPRDSYDLTVDTARMDARACARQILAQLP